MAEMNQAQIRSFLMKGTRTAKVATVRADGRPHLAPVWFDLDEDGTLLFTTGATSLKGKALRRDPRIALCVEDDTPPFAFVVIEGTVTIDEDLGEMMLWACRIGGRYMGSDRAEEYGRRNAVPGELLVRVTPTHVVAQTGVAS